MEVEAGKGGITQKEGQGGVQHQSGWIAEKVERNVLRGNSFPYSRSLED